MSLKQSSCLNSFSHRPQGVAVYDYFSLRTRVTTSWVRVFHNDVTSSKCKITKASFVNYGGVGGVLFVCIANSSLAAPWNIPSDDIILFRVGLQPGETFDSNGPHILNGDDELWVRGSANNLLNFFVNFESEQ